MQTDMETKPSASAPQGRMNQSEVAFKDLAGPFLRSLKGEQGLGKLMRRIRSKCSIRINCDRTYQQQAPLSTMPDLLEGLSPLELSEVTHSEGGITGQPVWVYQTEPASKKLDLHRPLSPPSNAQLATMYQAARCNHTVALAAYCLASSPTHGPLLLTSTGLGGECEVLSIKAVSGVYRAPANSVLNPLIATMAPPAAGSATVHMESCKLLLEPGQLQPDGSTDYKHVWLQAKVRSSTGEHDVWLDPTAAQFDRRGADIKVWHSASPQDGERYIPSSESGIEKGIPATYAESYGKLQKQLYLMSNVNSEK